MFLNCISPNVDTTRIHFLWIGFWNSSNLCLFLTLTISLLNVFGNITISLFVNRFWLIRFYKTWSIAMVPAHTGLHSLIPYFYSEELVWSSNELGGTPLASACHPSVIHICIEYSYPYSKNAFQYELNLALLRLSCTKIPLP